MGAALDTASAMGAYVLSDRGTWISFRGKGDLGSLWKAIGGSLTMTDHSGQSG